MILVNIEKKNRAEEILLFILGTKSTKDDMEKDRKNKFTALLQAEKVDPKSDGALEFIYKKLGGATRTEAEQKVVEAKVEEIKKGRGRPKKDDND